MENQDASATISEYVSSLQYESLPSEVVDVTKKGILDTLGVILGASGTVPEAEILVDMITRLGGRPDATILGCGDRVPAWHAAYVNGAMAHALDYDDLHGGGLGHLYGPIVPAALAMAEQTSGTTGRDLIAAVCAGVDLLSRLNSSARATGNPHEWHAMSVNGVFGATVAAARIAGLDARRLTGNNTRGFVYALPGETGVRSSMMAEAGLAGVQNSFDGDAGLLNVYYQGEYSRAVLLDALGERFLTVDAGFKPWPACGFAHIYIDMVLGLMKEHEIIPDDVSSVTVTVGDFAQRLCEPLEQKRRPSASMEAKFSLPFTMAVAMVRGGIIIRDYLPAHLADKDILDFAKRVQYKVEHRFDFDPNASMPAGAVEISMRDGSTYEREQKIAFGNPAKPMSWEDLSDKFADCAENAASTLPSAQVAAAVEMLTNLEKVDEIGQVVDALGPKRQG